MTLDRLVSKVHGFERKDVTCRLSPGQRDIKLDFGGKLLKKWSIGLLSGIGKVPHLTLGTCESLVFIVKAPKKLLYAQLFE